VRRALRGALAGIAPGALVLVACSGGADSLALAAATLFEAPRAGLRAGLVTVDHGLQPGSRRRAEELVAWSVGRGFAPAEALSVTVGRAGGPEGAARSARYAALERAAARYGAAAVLLGHTREDQAENVLLALARGSGARSLAGMAAARGVYRRPLLSVARASVREAAELEKLPVWEDPHNEDPRFARSRLRALLPQLEEVLGGGVIAGLARSAELARADAEYLEGEAGRLLTRVRSGDALAARPLAEAPGALRGRALHAWLRALGVPGAALTSAHVEAVDALLVAWRGQGAVALPGGLAVRRADGRLVAWREGDAGVAGSEGA
jgi:tRNA(Ile)-lysidine synthase